MHAFEPVFFERGLTFSYDVEPGLFVLGDEAQLKRCANILLDNAQKYAAPGGACSLRLMRHGKNRCRLCISSEGARRFAGLPDVRERDTIGIYTEIRRCPLWTSLPSISFWTSRRSV